MTALAFALIGHLYDETHTRELPDLGGLAHQMPFIAACGVIAAMASSGLPGFGNFIAELLIFAGGWNAYPIQVICGVLGVVITSVYMLRLVRGTFFGEPRAALAHAHDRVSPFSRLPFVVLIGVLLLVGCWPGPLLRLIDAGSRPLIEHLVTPPLERFARALR